MLVARPISTPTRRSVATIATTVTKKGTNCLRPSLHICLKTFGLASLKPVAISTAASAASGIRFSAPGMSSRQPRSSAPWKIVARRVRAPFAAFTELRTITEVIGRPPTRPASMLPVPCATSSRFGGETRRSGSSLSVASRLRSVSREATTARVTAARSTAGSFHREKSGNVSRWFQAMPSEPTTGTVTRWLCSMDHADPAARSASLMATPMSTAASGAGNFSFFSGERSHAISTAKHVMPTNSAPGTKNFAASVRCVIVVVPSGLTKDMSPSFSESYPTRWGICFRISSTPMATSRPLITLFGK